MQTESPAIFSPTDTPSQFITYTPTIAATLTKETVSPYPTETTQPTVVTIPLHTPVVSWMTASEIENPLVYPQTGSPAYLINYIHPELGCNWLGVVGQIFDLTGKPVMGKIIEVDGSLNNQDILGLGLTGNNIEIGPAGYEIKLADAVYASDSPLRIQVFNSDGSPLSNPIPFVTYADCNKNLIVFNFLMFPYPLGNQVYLPVISR
ncbi:MAG: hypothetical protein ACPL6F_01935 [Anaerolineales bacterium]